MSAISHWHSATLRRGPSIARCVRGLRASSASLTELDHVRLTRLLQRQPAEPAVIGELLDVAQVRLPSRAVGPDVVTM